MAVEESNLLNRWRLKWADWAVLLRNNVGQAWTGTIIKEWKKDGDVYITLRSARRIAFGLVKGSGDYIGWKSVIITPEMVGKRVAIFTSAEGKTKDGVMSDEQNTWFRNVRDAGGIAMVIRSPDQKPTEWDA